MSHEEQVKAMLRVDKPSRSKALPSNRHDRATRRLMAKENAKRPAKLTEVPRDQWPNTSDPKRFRVWVSRDYMVQAFREIGADRLSVNRTTLRPDGRWEDELSWDELQNIKRQCGYGERFAVEVYPADHDLVNVANMRNLWVPDDPPLIGWRNTG